MSFFWLLSGLGSVEGALANAKATGAARNASAARSTVVDLENRLNRALMACDAMWSIMREKLGVTDEELLKRIQELDLSDGRLDGKVRRDANPCPGCGRPVSPRIPHCIYCGKPAAQGPFA
ncbi:MAG: hypothetical protein AABZ12_00375 [Planctomycetota bacterium]